MKISSKLISQENKVFLKDKFEKALKTFMTAKVDEAEKATIDGEVPRQVIKEYLDYVKSISDDYLQFRKKEEDLVLLGG